MNLHNQSHLFADTVKMYLLKKFEFFGIYPKNVEKCGFFKGKTVLLIFHASEIMLVKIDFLSPIYILKNNK